MNKLRSWYSSSFLGRDVVTVALDRHWHLINEWLVLTRVRPHLLPNVVPRMLVVAERRKVTGA